MRADAARTDAVLPPPAVSNEVSLASASAAPLPSERSDVRGQRIHFVDLVRLAASLQMVHGHSLDALMAEELRQGVVYERWSWGRGLVSVAFMFAAGLSYHLSTLARFEQHRADRGKVWRRFRRGGWLIALGYLLHFPAGAFSGDPVLARASLEQFQMVDVLQCIGLSIVALEAMTLLARNARQVVYASAALAVAAFAFAPLTEPLDPSGPLRALINYGTHRGGSLFPVLPWSGYVFAGVVAAEVALPRGTRTPPTYPIPRLAACAVAVLAAFALADRVPFSLGSDLLHRNALPSFNLLKLAVVLAIVTALSVIGWRIQRLPRVLQILAGESLILYVSHLLLLYGSFVGLSALIGHTLPLPAALTVATLMIPLTAGIGLAWHRLKRRRRA